MSTYEIINPSDKCTLSAATDEIAACAILILGEGSYGLHRADSSFRVPIFLGGGAIAWFEGTFGRPLADVIRSQVEPIAEALESVHLPSRRTSLTDIARNARDLAAGLRECAAQRKERAL